MTALTFVLFFVGFAILIRGAEWLINGASALAKHWGVSELVVGLTIVAFGTSLPELIVNLFANSEGAGDLAIGNILGTNIANTLLLLGIAATIHPLTVHRHTVYREVLFHIMATALLGLLMLDVVLVNAGANSLNRIDSIVLVSYFVVLLYYNFWRSRPGALDEKTKAKRQSEPINYWPIVFKILVGIIFLYLGGRWIVEGASEFASLLGASDALIGITIVAVGTSLPELASAVVAARQGKVDLAVGSAVGSNLFNIFMALGLSAIFGELFFSSDLFVDLGVALTVSLVLFGTMVFGKYRHQISKPEGKLFFVLYLIYLIFVIVRG